MTITDHYLDGVHAQVCCCGWRREYRTSLTTDHRARLDVQRHAHTCEQHRAQAVADIDARLAALGGDAA